MKRMYQSNPERPMNAALLAWERLIHGGPAMFPEQVAIYRHLARRLRGQRVVDVGCGMGVGTNLLAYWGCHVLGIDLSADALRVARALYPDLSFLQWDITKGSLILTEGPVTEMGQVDACVAVELIEHIEDTVTAIRHLLASGRTLYVSTPNRASPVLRADRPANAYHVREYTPQEMLELLGPATIRDPFSWAEVGPDSLMTPLVYEVGDAR